MAAPTIADCDNDGGLEIIISLKDTLRSCVQIWDVPNSAANCILWGTGRGNFKRQGQLFKSGSSFQHGFQPFAHKIQLSVIDNKRRGDANGVPMAVIGNESQL